MSSQRPVRTALLVILAAGLTLPWLARTASASSRATHSTGGREQLIAVSGPVGGKSLTGFVLATMSTQGKNLNVIAPARSGPQMSDFEFTWSPDGRSIAYPCSKGINDEHYAVCVVNVATAANHRLTSSPSVAIKPFAWGPGDQIASDCNDRDICFVNAKTGRITFVTRTGTSARNGYVFGDDLVWSPDGRTLALTCRRNDQQDRRFCFLHKDGKLTVQARSWNSVRVEGWTPDSKRIVWWGRFSGSQPLTYHEQNVDGSGLEPLPINAVVLGPHYTADGHTRLITLGAKPGIAEEPVSGGPTHVILGPRSGADVWNYAFQPAPSR